VGQTCLPPWLRESAIRNPQSAIRRRSRRGTSLIELVLCIPLLAGVLALTMFFGWAMMNQQNVKSAARYVAWRHLYGGWPQHNPLNPAAVFDPCDPNNGDDRYHPWLNAMFFQGRADHIGVGGRGAGTGEYEALAAAAGKYGAAPGQFADGLLLPPTHFDYTRGGSVSAHFPSSFALWQKYTGSISGWHVRDGVEWRRGQADCRDDVRDQFLPTLDAGLLGLPVPADDMGRMVRGLYNGGW